MANYTFKPAVREEVGLIIGVAGPSGSGKTYSAMRMAAGIVGPGIRFAVIDTENRRALHYAEMFAFDHLDLGEPFRPEAYADAIRAADKAGYKAIVVDSMSHEWAGVGGILDWQEEELNRMAGDSWSKRESCKMASWIKPKMEHKKMMQRLLQTKANLILCFRAEEKVKMVKVSKNGQEKTEIVNTGWQPICEKNLPYELMISLLMEPEKPGIPIYLKRQEQHKPLFPEGELVNESMGASISAWAKGGVASAPRLQQAAPSGDTVIDNRIKLRIHELAQKKLGENYLQDENGREAFVTIKVRALGENKPTNTLTVDEADKVIALLDELPVPLPAHTDEASFGATGGDAPVAQ